MMDAVKKASDRQELHERIRELSMEAGKRVKEEGLDNNLLSLIAQEPMFMTNERSWQRPMDPSRYVGCAPRAGGTLPEGSDRACAGRE